MSNLNTRQAHPLIRREQNYVLDRKLISFHSQDRDISKWSNSNHFEVQLPENLKNVQSMRLDAITFPNSQLIFSTAYQNTKLSFKINENMHTITISPGAYSTLLLVTEIQNKMNSKVSEFLGSAYDHFVCAYNEISNTFWFGNTQEQFNLLFDKQHDYGLLCGGQRILFGQYTKWGLPSYLGYQKKEYSSTLTKERYTSDPIHTSGVIPEGGEFDFDYSDATVPWLDGITNYIVDINEPFPPENYGTEKLLKWRKEAKIGMIDILGDESIYMEIDRYNSMDEIAPYSENTNGLFNNDYHGKVNSAFAKIPVLASSFGHSFDSRSNFLMNVSQYEPPIEKITRLKFKFRYHDGRLVDFGSAHISFTIEFNMLLDQQLRVRNVRVPNLYRL